MYSEAPIKYNTTIKKADLSYIKVECKSVNGNKVKEELNKHIDDDSPENYLLLVKSIKTLIKRYKWFDITENNDGIKLAFETMNRALLNNPLDQWKEVVIDLRANQMNTKNGFKKFLAKLTEDICGEYAADNQREYMNNERKPKDMSMNEFFAKLLQMNNMIPILDLSTSKYNTSELGKIIAKVLPGRLVVDYIKQGEKKLTTEGEIKILLNTLVEADTANNKIRSVKERHNINQRGNGIGKGNTYGRHNTNGNTHSRHKTTRETQQDQNKKYAGSQDIKIMNLRIANIILSLKIIVASISKTSGRRLKLRRK